MSSTAALSTLFVLMSCTRSDVLVDEADASDTDASGDVGSDAEDGGVQAECGNGVVEPGEACDSGPEPSSSCDYGFTSCLVCTATCDLVPGTTAFCGDGVLQAAFETCDDGNWQTESCPYGETACSVCDGTCQEVPGATTYCGDGIYEPEQGEACDDGNDVDGDLCSDGCQTVVEGCGNGVLEAGEFCEIPAPGACNVCDVASFGTRMLMAGGFEFSTYEFDDSYGLFTRGRGAVAPVGDLDEDGRQDVMAGESFTCILDSTTSGLDDPRVSSRTRAGGLRPTTPAPVNTLSPEEEPIPVGECDGARLLLGSRLEQVAWSIERQVVPVQTSDYKFRDRVTTFGVAGYQEDPLSEVAGTFPVGDVDGDGRDDAIMTFYYPFESSAGPATLWLVFGSGLAAESQKTPGYVWLPLTSGDWGRVTTYGLSGDYGYVSFTSAGDVDNDGRGEMAVASRDAVSIIPGAVFSDWDTSTEFDVLTEKDSSWTVSLGVNVRIWDVSAGDVDGDGLDDLLVVSEPVSALIWGATLAALPPGSMVDSSLVDYVLPGGRSGTLSGDIDGDGRADMVLGSPRSADTSIGPGAAYVYMASVFDDRATVGTLAVEDASHTWLGSGQSMELGTTVTYVGDMDGDGLGDVSATARGAQATYIFLGTDLTGIEPGSAESVVTDLEGRATFVFKGPQHRTSSLGDVDGDGRSDLLCEQGERAGPRDTVYYALSPL